MNDNMQFSEKHPKLSIFLGLITLLILLLCGIYAGIFFFDLITNICTKAINLLKTIASSFDVVVIVALITGTVSIIGVIISSIISKLIDYKKTRQDYLAKKREQPYGEFVEMLYKVHLNEKQKINYTQKEMIDDLSKFSRQITLWGSPNVVNKWVEFRENGTNPNAGKQNLLIMEEIMNEMRKDLGLKKVKKGNLLAFIINDVKTIIK